MNLEDFFKPENSLSIGKRTIFLYRFTTNVYKKLEELLVNNDDEIIRFKKILPLIASLENNKDHKPLSEDFINELTGTELENIAQLVSCNTALLIVKKGKEKNTTPIQKEENESYIKYVNRLLLAERERYRATQEKRLKDFNKMISPLNEIAKYAEINNAMLGNSINEIEKLERLGINNELFQAAKMHKSFEEFNNLSRINELNLVNPFSQIGKQSEINNLFSATNDLSNYGIARQEEILSGLNKNDSEIKFFEELNTPNKNKFIDPPKFENAFLDKSNEVNRLAKETGRNIEKNTILLDELVTQVKRTIKDSAKNARFNKIATWVIIIIGVSTLIIASCQLKLQIDDHNIKKTTANNTIKDISKKDSNTKE